MSSTDHLHEWLCTHLKDGALLSRRRWLERNYIPQVTTEQETHIMAHIAARKSEGLSVMLDGSTDPGHDVKPINFLIGTSSALYFCDTAFFAPTEEETSVRLLSVVRKFCLKWLPGDLCDHVQWIHTDNEAKMESLAKMLSVPEGLFPNATWLGCLAHGVNRIGVTVIERKEVSVLVSVCQSLSSILKGKKNIAT